MRHIHGHATVCQMCTITDQLVTRFADISTEIDIDQHRADFVLRTGILTLTPKTDL